MSRNLSGNTTPRFTALSWWNLSKFQFIQEFTQLPEEERKTDTDAVKSLRRDLSPQPRREHFFTEFDFKFLRPEEGPWVYKWELENILSKADPSLSEDAKTALLTRQFSRGLPQSLKVKMLEHNPTPILDEMIEFTKRFRALGR